MRGGILALGSALILGAAALGGAHPHAGVPVSRPHPAPPRCTATDGDTIRCGQERIRLVEIDAPEMSGHCRKGRVCAPGNPHTSRASLQRFIQGRRIHIHRYGVDRYGRTLADVLVWYQDLRSASCHQIHTGHAVRQLKWADYGVTARCTR